MQPSYGIGELVENLWEMHEPDAHSNGYRLALHHPEHGLLITEDVEWFMVRRVALIPITDKAELAKTALFPSLEILFHISGHEIWTPFQISYSLPGTSSGSFLSLPDPVSQPALADYADRWAERLHAQQWITQAMQYPSSLAAMIQTNQRWEPDATTLQHWLMAENTCEAVDGCLIASSSACAHGYHSWAKELGYTT
jgi:hypothetical protein